MLGEALNIGLQGETQVPAIIVSSSEAATDAILVQAVLEGDESAFAEIFNRHKRLVTGVIARFFRDRNEIEEFVQQSFTKSYFSLKNYRGGEERSFPAWISRIAVNVCYDEFRRRQRKGERLFSEMSDDESEYIDGVADGRERSSETNLVAAQLAEKLLSTLDAKDRIAMTLVYSEDYSLAEVADALSISTSNLKSRLFRCRNQIRSRFGHIFR